MPVTQTGMDEARRTVAQLSDRLTAELMSVAARTGTRIRDGARARLKAQTHGTGRTAEAIRMSVDEPNKRVLVESKAVRPAPANLPSWLEYGTSKMTAKSYMRPSAEAEANKYSADMRAAVERAATAVGL